MNRGRIALVAALAGLAFLAPAAEAQLTLPSAGLISWWRADGDATDSVGTYDATANGGATYATGAGTAGQAFSFDGVDDYFRADATVNIDGGAAATYLAWVYPTTAPSGFSYVGIVTAGDGRDSSWNPLQCRLTYGAPDNRAAPPTANFYMDCGVNNANAYVWRESSAKYSTDTWHFVVGVFNNGTIDLYVNGALANGSGSTLAGASINTSAENYVSIGAMPSPDNASASVPFQGSIDEVAIYNRALSAVEIAAIFGSLPVELQSMSVE